MSLKVVAEYGFFDFNQAGAWVRTPVPRGRAARVVVDMAVGWTTGSLTVKGAVSGGPAADFDSGAVTIAPGTTGKARVPASDLHDYDEIEIEHATANGAAARGRIRVLVEDEGEAPTADTP